MKKITIIDYGLGNIGSVAKMLKKIGANYKISSSKEDIENAEKLILPGVGAFDEGVKVLNNKGYFEIIKRKVIEDKIPILGICLGMQLLTNGSEEGIQEGFGFIDADVKHFNFAKENRLKIPHMGWNVVDIKKQDSIFSGIEREQRFYFVHSYAVSCNNDNDVLALTTYGDIFVSAFQKENIFGAQFHPEKSHKFGINLFKNFNNKY
ncbi:imidazole glycerol phosphate synthase subunit HisH [Tenacibaculum ovolyticum]|uniref:imidazole glycerol phosphate synthase subunit HisH n=1 Tax=Tenacibaculum ovolyticum TaxID=104270 RepID=UPI003BAB97EF